MRLIQGNAATMGLFCITLIQVDKNPYLPVTDDISLIRIHIMRHLNKNAEMLVTSARFNVSTKANVRKTLLRICYFLILPQNGTR